MTDEQILLLRKSFDVVERQAHVAALAFYQKLFAADPSLRPLFKTGIEEQSRKLIDMLGLALSLSTNQRVLQTELLALGARHRTYGVKTEHYATVGQALLAMLKEVLGAQFTPAVRKAWSDYFQFIATTMQRGAADEALVAQALQSKAAAR